MLVIERYGRIKCMVTKYKTIILDDDIYRAQEYVDQLNIYGFDTVAVESISTFLKMAVYEEYQVFVLDIQMNDTKHMFSLTETHGGWATGLALYHKLRSICPDAKIVALTYSSLPEAVEWFTHDESVDYFNKEEYSPKTFPNALYNSVNNYYEINCIEQHESEMLLERSNKSIKFSDTFNFNERDELKVQRKLQIFVSSTYTDLIEERQAAVEAILQSDNIPAGMELFKSSNESQLETIKRWIDESDIYLLILGGRYGSLEPKSKFSYTHLEYNYALEKKKPLFSIVISEDTLNKKVKKYGSQIMELENREKYSQFRKQVLNRTSQFYEDTKDIKICILNSINDFEKRFNFTGWISGKYLLDYSSIKEENIKLKKLLGNKKNNYEIQVEKEIAIDSKVNFRDINIESVNNFIKKISLVKNAVSFINWFMKNIYDTNKYEFSKNKGDNSNLHLYKVNNNLPAVERFLLRIEYNEKQNSMYITFKHNRGKGKYISKLKDYEVTLMNNGYNDKSIVINDNISAMSLTNIQNVINKLFK